MGTPRWPSVALALALAVQPALALQDPQTQQAEPRAAGNGAKTGGTRAPPSYGPVLYVNGKPVADTGRRDPAEVHDEADTGANPATPAAATPATPQDQPAQQRQQHQQQQQRRQQAARHHPAWQAGNAPMAPRPLHGEPGTVSQGVPIPPPAAAPQPVVPSSSVINGCQGSACMDSSGKTYNGIGSGNAGVDSSGRLCSRTGTTVQCF